MEEAASGFWTSVLIAVIGGLVGVVGGALVALFVWMTASRYLAILADTDTADFKTLRDQIDGTDTVQTTYQSLLEGFLDKIDWFFDRRENEDAGASTRHAPGRPLTWTANAYDRCLLLAVAYPVVTSFVVWVSVGQAGDLGLALGMVPNTNAPFRVVTAVGIIGCLLLLTQSIRLFDRIGGDVWAISASSALVYLLTIFIFPDFFGEYEKLAARTNGISIALAFFVPFGVAFSGAGFILVFRLVLFLVDQLRNWGLYGPFLLLLTLSLLASVFGWAYGEATTAPKHVLLVSFGLLPLVNAPFDWASLGLTRFLLRKNLEARSAVSRARLSLTDFGLALLALVLLALTLILALEVFNARVRPGLGHDYVDVRAQLEAIGDNPSDPGHFWIYFTLFSTLIPTLMHAVIWCASLVTVRVPGLRARILDGMDRLGDGEGTRMGVAGLLTLRWVIAIGAVVVGTIGLGWLLLSVADLGPLFLDLLLWWQATFAGWLA